MLWRYRAPVMLANWMRTSVPVLAVESDDWGQGTLRDGAMRDAFVAETLESGADRWLDDAAESEEDLEGFARVLGRHHDDRGRTPQVGLNFVVSRPDYEHIAGSGYCSYRTIGLADCYALLPTVARLRKDDLVTFGLHGGEHFNPAVWLDCLARGDRALEWLFRHRIEPPASVVNARRGLGAAYLPAGADGEHPDGCDIDKRVNAACRHFVEAFGTTPRTLTPPNHCWNDAGEKAMRAAGIALLGAADIHYPSMSHFHDARYRHHRFGARSRHGLIYVGRNVDFEPGIQPASVLRAASRIRILLARRIPVVLNTHRVNYVSGIDPRRRTVALDALDALLTMVETEFPAVRYVGSEDIAALAIGGVPGPRAEGIAAQAASGRMLGLAADLWQVTVDGRALGGW